MKKINKILVVNDDGIDAVGIQTLIKIAKQLSDTIWVVAPKFEQSGVSRAVSIHRPIFVEQRTVKTFAIEGTPADCVIVAIEKLMDSDPDLILSGVNRGHNAADFLHISGTLGAAGMGSSYNIPSMALSLMGNVQDDILKLNWQMVEASAPKLIQKLFDMSLDAQNILNINFPDCDTSEVAGIKVCKHGKRFDRYVNIDTRQNTDGRMEYWLGFKGQDAQPQTGSELESLQENYITITAIGQNLTNFDMNRFIAENL